MNQANRQDRHAQLLAYIIGLVLVFVPFHAVFTTWLGSNFGHLDLFRIWKELIIFAMAPFAIYLAWSDQKTRRWLMSDWLPSLILLYILLHLLLGFVALTRGDVNRNALIFALLSNLRFLGFFIIVIVVASRTDFLKRYWRQIFLIPATVVLGFGLLQRFFLPYDFLRHFGYGPNTIPAFQTVDQKLAYRRIQSTLRGANPLGAYLVVVLPLLAFAVRKNLQRAVVVLAGTTVLFYTYSRSAWIGLGITLAAMAFWLAGSRRKQLFWTATAVTVLLASAIILFRHNTVVENSVFHTDNTSKSTVSSNASRLGETEQAIRDIVHQPLGRGPGTAGPASFRNNHPARIAENYFLQIGQEVGVVGMVVFIAINVLVAKDLWHQRQRRLVQIILATLLGLTVINLVSHAWSDDTLAYLWWGLAGIALAPAILNEKRKAHGYIQEKR